MRRLCFERGIRKKQEGIYELPWETYIWHHTMREFGNHSKQAKADTIAYRVAKVPEIAFKRHETLPCFCFLAS